jgi:hypothetical protein
VGKKLNLSKDVNLYCDGQLVNIPNNLENILVLNINYWAGGAHDIWGN